MYPGHYARTRPDHPAVIMAESGETITYRQLDERSNRLAHLFREAGLRPGDGIALLLENQPRHHEVLWAALRSGLYFTSINTYLTPDEAAYIVNDSGARALVTSQRLRATAEALVSQTPDVTVRLMTDGPIEGFEAYEDVTARQLSTALPDEPRGEIMLYSSGSTGRPKGIRRPLSGDAITDATFPTGALLAELFDFDGDTRYLSPAPMYHSAPLAFTAAVQVAGGTAVMMERFDPVQAIRHIDDHAITHSQWVPTMFNRMLKVEPEVRASLDGATHQMAIHAAAPCPAEIKQQMIDWWGPILVEHYSATESAGFVMVDSHEWVQRPGTVGRAVLGTIRICDEHGQLLPAGKVGTIYFERDDDSELFHYHNAPEKTRGSRHPVHERWVTVGDLGYVDEEDYLYLTDRKDFMIISGGVNIYPREIEDVAIMHPDVADVAVIGIPDPDMGESVKAVVQLEAGLDGTREREQELHAWLRERLAGYKVPRSIDVVDELPRLPTGKLYKTKLLEHYRELEAATRR